MYGGPLRVLEIYGDAADFGRIHGGTCSSMIKAYLADRLVLSGESAWAGKEVDSETVLSLAEDTVPHHRAYSESLYEEMVALADAAGITPAEAVVVGGFTDLIDVVRADGGSTPTEDECTALIDPDAKILAQTWDMHPSAGEFVMMLKLDPVKGPAALVQTTAGCVGQVGMNEAGIAIGINNLTAFGKPGVTWPFVVRNVLQQTDFDIAVSCVLDADLAGGHNFLLMGPDGEGVNIEAMPGSVRVDRVREEAFVHTNHCIDAYTRLEEGKRPEEQLVSSHLRLERGRELARDLESFFSDPAIAKPHGDQHLVATCGAMIMHPAERRIESVWGLPGQHSWETFRL